MRRIVSVFAAMAVMAAVVAAMAVPAFAAQKQALPPGCTSAKGVITCVETKLLESTTVRSGQQGTTWCSSSQTYVPTYYEYLRETFGETTTTYKKSGAVISTSYRGYVTETFLGVVNDCAA